MSTTTTPPAESPGSPTPAVSALRDPQFLRYLAGQSLSELGDQVWYVALSWTAVRLGSPGIAGVLLTLTSLPRIALMLFGGVIADRFDIRRVMIASDSLRTVIVFAAAGIAISRPSIPLLVVIALVYGTVDGVFMPAAGAMQPRLLGPEQYNSGAAASNMLGRLALTAGAPLGGVIVAIGGLPLALAVDGITFAASVATLATVSPRRVVSAVDTTISQPAATLLSELIIGARFLVSEPVLGPLTAISLLSNLGFVGPMNIGLAELSDHRGWGPTGIGVMLAGFGIGAAGSALLMLRWKIHRGAGIWIGGLSALSGTALLAMALAPDLALAATATVALGLAAGPMAVASSVLQQQQTPDHLRGRISSFNLLATYGSVPIAMIGTGLAIAAIGVTGTFTVCAAIEATAVLFLLAPTFRKATIHS